MSPLAKRRKITEATKARFGLRVFRWGYADCARMGAWHLRRFGYKVPQVGGYTTAITASRRLQELGFKSLPELVGSLGMEEIAPAFAMAGDVVSFAADSPIGAIGIVVGNGNMMAYHESHDTPVIMAMGVIDRAWKVI